MTAVVVAVLAAVAAAALVDALRVDSADRSSAPRPAPPCRQGQLALTVVAEKGGPAVVLRHARGSACSIPESPVTARIVSASGEAEGTFFGPQGWGQCAECEIGVFDGP